MTYRHEQRRAMQRRFIAQVLTGDAGARLTPQRPAATISYYDGRTTTAARHPMRTHRTVLSSVRSSNPRIRAAAKATAIALGVLPGGLVHPLVAQAETREG